MNERPKTSPELDKALNTLLTMRCPMTPVLLGSRPAEPDVVDWRIPVDMAIVGLGYELDRLQALLVKEREAGYLCQLDNAAILMSRLTKLQLICSLVRERRASAKLQAAE